MARNEVLINASRERVFELLSDPVAYAEWVPGTRAIGDADENWPANGSWFEYMAGLGWLALRDRATVRRADPPVLLELRIQARPLAPARVVIELVSEGEGTRVGLIEEPDHPALRLLIGPVGHALIRLRNVEALRRLKRMAEAGR